MTRRRGRRLAMTAAGLATAATPLLLGQQAAGATIPPPSDQKTLDFVTRAGERLSCRVSLYVTYHDGPDQPQLLWATVMDGPTGCVDDFATGVTATYKDSEGVVQTVTSLGPGETGGSVTGAYPATSVSANVYFHNCDSVQSPSCSVTVAGSPK